MTRIRILSLLVLLAPTLSPMNAQAGRRPMADAKLDFSAVTTREEAVALARQGKLVKILIFPGELGGEDIPENVTYVPSGAAQAQTLIIGTLQRFAAQGLIDRMTVEPAYRGDSFVPTRIAYHATKNGKKGSFNPAITVW